FKVAALRLESVHSQLHGRDSLLAGGLIALGKGEFQAACDAYRAALTRDSLDVIAWYGMGDCQSMDKSVIADRRSPSGWRFTTSWYSAAKAYMRAVTIDPTAHKALPYAQMTGLLPTDPLYMRRGQTLNGDMFGA